MRISDWSSDVCSSDLLTHVEHNLAVEGAESLSAEHLAALVKMETSGELTATQAKAVLAEMVDTGEAPEAIAEAKGYEAMSSDSLEEHVDEANEAQPDRGERFPNGDDTATGKHTGFFVGTE